MDKHSQQQEHFEEQKNSQPELILATFRLLDNQKSRVDVSLVGKEGTNRHICCSYEDGRSEIISWRDLLGAVVEDNRIDIVAFPKKVHKRMFKKTENRFKEIHSFRSRDKGDEIEYESYNSSVKRVSINEVKYIIQEFAQQIETEMFTKIISDHRVQKELLVFINPHSGKGQAQPIFDRIKDLFEISGHRYHVVETLYRLHCFDYLYELDAKKLFSYSGIVSVSGDGTPHEIINALLLRPDRERCIQMPIGSIHGGSGNAFPTTMCNLSGEYSTPECAAYLIIKNQTKQLDLMEFEREIKGNDQVPKHPFTKSKRIYSFLSLSWTYVSDLDLGSESLRFLGETRFEVYGLWRLLFLNKYAANMLYSNSTTNNLPDINQPVPEQDLESFKAVKNQQFTFFYLSNLPWVSEKYKSFPLASVEDGLFDLIFLTNQQSKFQVAKTALALDNGSFFDLEKKTVAKGYDLNYEKVRSIRLQPVDPLRSGFYAIDGERYPAEPIQGTVLPKILNIFCL